MANGFRFDRITDCARKTGANIKKERMKIHTIKKRIAAMLLMLTLVVSACFVMTSCGSSSNDEQKKNDIETYMKENDEVRKSFEETTLSQDEHFQVGYDGDAVVVTYAYDEEIADADVDTYKTVLESGLESQKDQVVGAANDLKETAGVDKVIIRYIFTDKNGKELTTVEFESDN